MNKTLLYVAKEPDDGVISDLQSFSDHDITVCACNPGYVDYYKLLGYNVITHHKFFTTVDMRFDVVIGNPPYTDTSSVVSATGGGCSKGLDDIFFLKAMELSPCVSLIIRAKYFAKINSKFRRTLFESGKIKSIRFLSESVFPTISLTQTCVVTFDQNHKGETKVEYLDGSIKSIMLTSETCLKANKSDYVSVVDNNMSHRYERGQYNLNQLQDGDMPMIITMGGKRNDMIVRQVSADQHNCCVNQHGVVMNSKYGGKGFGKIMIKPYDHSISGSAIILKTNSLEESKKLKEHLEREDIYQISIDNKISNANTKELFKTIPDMV